VGRVGELATCGAFLNVCGACRGGEQSMPLPASRSPTESRALGRVT